jgi:ketosteroid isomerase-like protein
VDLVRRIYEAWDREESARDFISEDVEYVNPSYAVEPGVRRGSASFRVVRETYEDFRIAIERFIDAGRDEHGYLWTVRDGRLDERAGA